MRFAIAAAVAAVLGVAIGGSPARAREGHDHAEQAAPAPASTSSSARAEARSEAFELVAVARGEELSIYLDRFTTNEPVEGAVIEVETPAGPITALGKPGEAYRIAGPWLTKPGPVDLIAEEVSVSDPLIPAPQMVAGTGT
jgi:cobalt-zinc-cadmium efflux system membrane fusion protein